jgi:hypothetical protein
MQKVIRRQDMAKKQSAKKPVKVKALPKKKKEPCKDGQQKVENFGQGAGIWIHSGAKPQ